jgi:PAS domain S-box-containing protein
MNINFWKGRQQAAEAVLSAPAPSVSVLRKALADAAVALNAAITELDETMGEVRRLREDARASDQRYTSLLCSIPVALVTTSRDGRIVELNQDAATLLNLSARAAIGRSLLVFFSERESWLVFMREMRDAASSIRRDITLRPRERGPRPCTACVSPTTDGAIHWYLLAKTEKPASDLPGSFDARHEDMTSSETAGNDTIG